MCMRTFFLSFVVLILAALCLPSDAAAAKKRIFGGKPTATVASYSSAKLSRSTNSVVVTFKNLGRVKRIDYTLSYAANGISQGVVGSFVPNGGSSETRDLYFGTCSKGVCTPHYGITNAVLTVTTTLSNGATNTKRYIIKRV
jgi:hypothetical protein